MEAKTKVLHIYIFVECKLEQINMIGITSTTQNVFFFFKLKFLLFSCEKTVSPPWAQNDLTQIIRRQIYSSNTKTLISHRHMQPMTTSGFILAVQK